MIFLPPCHSFFPRCQFWGPYSRASNSPSPQLAYHTSACLLCTRKLLHDLLLILGLRHPAVHHQDSSHLLPLVYAQHVDCRCPLKTLFLIAFSNVIESSFLSISLKSYSVLTWFFTSVWHRAIRQWKDFASYLWVLILMSRWFILYSHAYLSGSRALLIPQVPHILLIIGTEPCHYHS